MKNICLTLLLFFGITACTQSSNSAKVTGEVVINANETSFHHAVVHVSLYEYHPYMADVEATLKDSKKILDIAHKKGTETRVPFTLGEQQLLVPEMEYYVTLDIYQHNAVANEYRLFYGKPRGRDMASVFGKNPNTAVFDAQKMKEYTGEEKPIYPQSFWCQIPEVSHPEMEATLRARLHVKQGTYSIDRQSLTPEAYEALLKKLKENPEPPFPPVPIIQMAIEIENVGKETITFFHGGDQGALSIAIEGPGHRMFPTATVFTEEERSGTPITLKPGEKHEFPISMTSGYRDSVNHYWTRPGAYRFSCSLKALFRHDGPSPYEHGITIESPEIALNIVELE